MNQLLIDRETGTLTSKAFARFCNNNALNSLQLCSTSFDGGQVRRPQTAGDDHEGAVDHDTIWAHKSGVNALVIDKFESRFMLSGGADGSIKLWDLEKGDEPNCSHVYNPEKSGRVEPRSSAHQFGITKLSFYSFDSDAFLSSSYDHFLRLLSTESLAVSASFDLDSVVYSHSMSPIATHLLVACATQHPIVRLCDLKSGASTHSLSGHQGALLSLDWSPTKEFVLASGDMDGAVRLWDIRSSAATLGVLNLEDSIGITGSDGLGLGARSRNSGKAHTGAVNGLTWTDDGNYLVTAGHDRRVRVWNMMNGSNTNASFGPTLKNNHLSTLPILVAPTALTPAGQNTLFYPNEQEILKFDLHEGRLQKRLKVSKSTEGGGSMQRRTTALAWRATSIGLYSAQSDGQIRAWLPKTAEDLCEDAEEELTMDHGEDDGSKKRKHEALDSVFRNLTRQKITFT